MSSSLREYRRASPVSSNAALTPPSRVPSCLSWESSSTSRPGTSGLSLTPSAEWVPAAATVAERRGSSLCGAPVTPNSSTNETRSATFLECLFAFSAISIASAEIPGLFWGSDAPEKDRARGGGLDAGDFAAGSESLEVSDR